MSSHDIRDTPTPTGALQMVHVCTQWTRSFFYTGTDVNTYQSINVTFVFEMHLYASYLIPVSNKSNGTGLSFLDALNGLSPSVLPHHSRQHKIWCMRHKRELVMRVRSMHVMYVAGKLCTTEYFCCAMQ